MAEKITRYNFRAIVDIPIGFGRLDEEQIQRDGRLIIEQIKRHVDVNTVYLEWDTEVTCEFCGSIWETEIDENATDFGIPICCVEAQEEWHRAKRKETDEHHPSVIDSKT